MVRARTRSSSSSSNGGGGGGQHEGHSAQHPIPTLPAPPEGPPAGTLRDHAGNDRCAAPDGHRCATASDSTAVDGEVATAGAAPAGTLEDEAEGDQQRACGSNSSSSSHPICSGKGGDKLPGGRHRGPHGPPGILEQGPGPPSATCIVERMFPKLEHRRRHLRQVFVRGESVVMVAVVPP
eukprot:jgi/Mesen1/7621/ME000004S07889